MLTPADAAKLMQEGEVVAYPTEAVYGLGCDPRNEDAIRKILALKSRQASAGLILIADRFEFFEPYIAPVPDEKLHKAMESWPGPVTWLFPRADSVRDWLAGRHATVAIRLTAHAVSREISAAFGGAIVSTSANPSAEPPARSAGQVREYFGESIAGTVEGALGSNAQPSEIRDLATGNIIRAG
jgi:L-threonylcarbamoyladenylate synthase